MTTFASPARRRTRVGPVPVDRVQGGRKPGITLGILTVLWFFVLFEPQWFLAAKGITAGLKAPVVLFVALVAAVAVGVPTVLAWKRRWTWYPPLLCFTATAVVMVPFALNGGRAWDGARAFFLMWVFVTATVAVIDTVRRAEILILAYALQFTLWITWSPAGRIGWHTYLGNYDSYGSWMVIGGGLCGFLILATESKWLRRLLAITLVGCAAGVVASFARGAFLAAVVLVAMAWLRSPRKGMTLMAGLGCVGVAVVTATILHGPEYWAEIATIADGTEEATGEDRWEMWKAAVQVFFHHPILGTGALNWGVFAAEYFRPGELGGDYSVNPLRLYNKQLHSSYFTVLAEHGIIGVFTFAWIIVDFWRRNLQLRTAAAAERWKALGGRLHLPAVALSLEAAFIGWLATASLYSMNNKHWFFTILALNLLCHSFVHGHPRVAARRRPVRATGRAGARGSPVPVAASTRTFSPDLRTPSPRPRRTGA